MSAYIDFMTSLCVAIFATGSAIVLLMGFVTGIVFFIDAFVKANEDSNHD